VLLIVMHESGTWRVRPGRTLTFGRGQGCTIRLPESDRGLSRSADSLAFHVGCWWLRNDSASSVVYLSGDRGFRVDLPPGMQIAVQQWHAKVRLQGVLDTYTLGCACPTSMTCPATVRRLVPVSTWSPAPAAAAYRLRPADPGRPVRAVPQLAARGRPRTRSAKEAAERIGWPAHTVAKRCENVRSRYARLGVPGLHGPRALEELALLLISTGELTAQDLQRLHPP
jgi:hypothetical protein